MGANEDFFGVPADHTLKQTDFRSTRGGQSERWSYEEFDAAGQLVARHSKWILSDFFGKVESEGWSKHAPDGTQLASGNKLV